MLKNLREIALAIAVMAGLILFGLLFYGLARTSSAPCWQSHSADGTIINPWCPEAPPPIPKTP